MRPLRHSRLQLEAHWLESLRYDANPDFEPSGEMPEVPLRFAAEYRRDTQVGTWVVRLRLQSRRRRGGNVPYSYSASLAGSFTIDGLPGELSEQDHPLIRLNAPAILYGVARGILAAATATAVYGPIMLPSGNLAATLPEWIEG